MPMLELMRGKPVTLSVQGLIDTIINLSNFEFSNSMDKITLFSDEDNGFFNISKDAIISISDESKGIRIQLSNATIKLSVS